MIRKFCTSIKIFILPVNYVHKLPITPTTKVFTKKSILSWNTKSSFYLVRWKRADFKIEHNWPKKMLKVIVFASCIINVLAFQNFKFVKPELIFRTFSDVYRTDGTWYSNRESFDFPFSIPFSKSEHLGLCLLSDGWDNKIQRYRCCQMLHSIAIIEVEWQHPCRPTSCCSSERWRCLLLMPILNGLMPLETSFLTGPDLLVHQ